MASSIFHQHTLTSRWAHLLRVLIKYWISGWYFKTSKSVNNLNLTKQILCSLHFTESFAKMGWSCWSRSIKWRDLTLSDRQLLSSTNPSSSLWRVSHLNLEVAPFTQLTLFSFCIYGCSLAKTQDICDRIQCGDGFVCNRNSPGRPCQGRVRQKIPRSIISVLTNHFICERHVQQSFITFKIDAFQYMLLSSGRCELLLKQNRLEYLGQPDRLLGINPAAMD